MEENGILDFYPIAACLKVCFPVVLWVDRGRLAVESRIRRWWQADKTMGAGFGPR